LRNTGRGPGVLRQAAAGRQVAASGPEALRLSGLAGSRRRSRS
jgi:hypothetical protein